MFWGKCAFHWCHTFNSPDQFNLVAAIVPTPAQGICSQSLVENTLNGEGGLADIFRKQKNESTKSACGSKNIGIFAIAHGFSFGAASIHVSSSVRCFVRSQCRIHCNSRLGRKMENRLPPREKQGFLEGTMWSKQ